MEKQLSEGFHVTATSELKQFPIYPWTPMESLERKSKRLPYSFFVNSAQILTTATPSEEWLFSRYSSCHHFDPGLAPLRPSVGSQLGILFSCVTMPVSLHLAVFPLVPFTENLPRSAVRRTVFHYWFQLIFFFSRLILVSNNMYVFRKSNCNHGNKNDGNLCCSRDSFLPCPPILVANKAMWTCAIAGLLCTSQLGIHCKGKSCQRSLLTDHRFPFEILCRKC